MANTITQKVKWNGVWVMAVTNIDSGSMEIYEEGWLYGTTIGSQKLAESNGGMDPNNYTLTRRGEDKLFEEWFKANPGKSKKDFNASFHTTGTTAFNNLRAKNINNLTDQGIIKSHYDAGVAGINNPDKPGETNNSEGDTVAKAEEPTPKETEPTIQQVEGNTPISPDQAWAEADMPPPTDPPPVMADIVKVGGNPGAYYTYPLNLSEQFQSNFDFIQLTAYEYKAPGFDTINVQDYGGGFDVNKEIWETYQLPMVPGKGEAQATSWGRNSENPGLLALAGHAGNLLDNPFDVEAAKKVFEDAKNDVKSVFSDPNTRQFLTSWMAGKAVGISGLMSRQSGMVINNNMELLFNGPKLRSFNFSWVLTPRSEDESIQIRAIIRSLKRNGAPQRSTSNLFLKAPRVFEVKYIMGPRGDHQSNDLHPYLNKFKTCALTNFNVKYDNGSSTTTYDKGSMTQYTISLSLSELSPIYADEYDENDDLNAPTTGY